MLIADLDLVENIFGKIFEFRNNWYVSITDEKSVTVDGTSYSERVVPGWDVEVGYRLPNNPQLAFFCKRFLTGTIKTHKTIPD